VDLGYPFIESVQSALPICDEFIISEGYSDDRTWEAVQALAKRYPAKIRVRRDRWTQFPDNSEVIARISNLALQDCTSDFCLYLQANEIIHEDALDALASLPGEFPRAGLVSLPFYNILGRDILWLHQNRNRFFRRNTGIHIGGDGYDACYDPRSRWALFWDRWTSHSTAGGLSFPQPVFRYRALYPSNYLRKLQVHRVTLIFVRKKSGGCALSTCPAVIRNLDSGWEFPFEQSLKSIAGAR
jgi:glycosyltransferase involved in cell wall biosynthesis